MDIDYYKWYEKISRMMTRKRKLFYLVAPFGILAESVTYNLQPCFSSMGHSPRALQAAGTEVQREISGQ